MNRLADLSAQILDEAGEFIRAMPTPRVPTTSARRSCSKSVPLASICEPDAAALLNKARELLKKAEDMLIDDWPDEPAVRRISPGCMRRKR